MKDITKKYSNEEITVVWKPSLCIHSKKCWTSLPTVFDPREKPWIKIEGASSDQIIKQINACPSGALSIINQKTENYVRRIRRSRRIQQRRSVVRIRRNGRQR